MTPRRRRHPGTDELENLRMKRRFRQRLVAPESMDALLERAGESRFARVRPPISAALWREAVGARIAERARPVSLWGGVLLLRVPSSVWAHELSLLTDEMCARLRERGVDAKELRFRVGALDAVERPPERRIARTVPTTFAVPPELTAPWRSWATASCVQPSSAPPPRISPGSQSAVPPLPGSQRSAASRSSPSSRCSRNRSAGPSEACFSRRRATYPRRRARSIALTLRNAL